MAKAKLSKKDTVIEAIEKINAEIDTEMKNFLKRKGLTEKAANEIVNLGNPLNQAGSGIKLSGEDTTRFQILRTLRGKIDGIYKAALNDNTPAEGLAEKYQAKLATAIESAVSNPQLTKQYSGLKKLGITLLNIVTSITVIPALIKKAGTGSLLYSTQGKSKEAVNKAKKITDKLAPKKNKPKN